MATNRTDSLIKSTGGDYTSVTAWVAAIGGAGIDGYTDSDLTATGDDVDHYGWVAAEEFNESVAISGHTCDSTHRIYLAADSNGATTTASQHSGTKTDAALMDDSTRALAYSSSYAAIKCTTYGSQAITGNTPYIHVSRMQLHAGPVGGRQVGAIKTTGGNMDVHRCLVDSEGNANYGNLWTQDTGSFTSCIFIQVGSGWAKSRSPPITNCTFVRSSGAPQSNTGPQLSLQYGRPAIENCAFFSGAEGSEAINNNGASSWTTLDYNATDHTDLNSDSGEGSNNTYSLTMSDQFTALDNTDWRVKSGHGLGVGTDKTATVAVDIWGTSFETSTSIVGCEQYVAAGGGLAIPIAHNHYQSMRTA